jgi:hypothetical protein
LWYLVLMVFVRIFFLLIDGITSFSTATGYHYHRAFVFIFYRILYDSTAVHPPRSPLLPRFYRVPAEQEHAKRQRGEGGAAAVGPAGLSWRCHWLGSPPPDTIQHPSRPGRPRDGATHCVGHPTGNRSLIKRAPEGG